jgi:hypothetical protein
MTERELLPENKHLLDLIDNLRILVRILDAREFERLETNILRNTINNYYGVLESNYDIRLSNEIIHKINEIIKDETIVTHHNDLLRCIYRFERCIGKKEKGPYDVEINNYFSNVRNFTLNLQVKYDQLLGAQKSKVAELEKENGQLKSTLRKSVGRSLERIYLPDLIESMEYELQPGVLPSNGEEIELDVLAEQDKTRGIPPSNKLVWKSVLLVEAKATILKEDIDEFSEKVKIVKGKYEIYSELFGCHLSFETWIVACYGWDDELKNMQSHWILSLSTAMILSLKWRNTV